MSRLSFKVASALALSVCLASLAAARQEPQAEQQRKCGRGNFQPVEGLMIRRVEFYGNTYTSDSLIRRKLLLLEGDRFGVRALRKGLDRVNRLGIFEKVADDDIEWCVVNGQPDEVDFVVEFKYKSSKRRRTR